MALSTTIQSSLLRHQKDIYDALHRSVQEATNSSGLRELQPFYSQMQYHLGWVDAQFAPIKNNPGKLLRPTLLLLAYEAAGAWGQATETTIGSEYLRRALPAA